MTKTDISLQEMYTVKGQVMTHLRTERKQKKRFNDSAYDTLKQVCLYRCSKG